MDLQAFFETSPELLAITDDLGRILCVNQAWQNLLHIAPERLVGVSIPDQLQGSTTAFNGTTSVQGRGIWPMGDGPQHWVDWTVFPIKEGQYGFTARLMPVETDRDTELAQLYRAIIEHADLSIIATDTHGVIQTFNHTASKLLGYLPEEVLGNRVPGIVHDWNEIVAHAENLSQRLGKPIKPGFEALIALPRDLGIPDESEWTYIRKNGDRFPVNLTVTALKDGLGRITGYIGVGKDISALKKAEEKIRASQLQLENFLEALPIGVYVLDKEGRPFYANQKSTEILGKGILPTAHKTSLNDVYQVYLSGTNELYPNDDMPIVKGLKGRESFVSDMVVRNGSKETPLEVWGQPVLDHEGKILYSIAAFIDVTERLKTQKQLLESLAKEQFLNEELNVFSIHLKKLHATFTQQYETIQEQFQAILQTGCEILNLSFASFGKVEGNSYTPQATIYPEAFPAVKGEQRLQETYCEFVVDRAKTVTYQEFGREYSGKVHPAYLTYRIEAFIGTPVWVHGRIFGTLSFSDLRPRAEGFNRHEKELIELMGQAIGFAIGSEENRQELEAASADLIASNEELTRINEELDQFAYVVSHDLKAPLRAINNISSWLEEDLGENLPGDSREHLNLLRNRVGRMDSMISGILAYSRAGRKKGNQTTVAIAELLDEVLDILQIPHRFTITIPANLPTLLGDRTELTQVFSNLIGNAVKYNHQAEGHIEILYKKKARVHRFGIKDNGPGIAPEYHDRIFGVFQRLEGRDEIEGTGVGLSIVRKIVESNGGKAWVESELGHGATFFFTWPENAPSITN